MTAIQPVNILLGSVVIGRNEGERLKRCLASLAVESTRTVYVDSGSSDGSVDHARSVGVDVVELDLSVPFTAARARNEGFERLLALYPNLTYVQFVDGDCEVVVDWIPKALNFLMDHPGLRRRLRSAPGAIPRAKHLQLDLRPRVGYPCGRGHQLRW